MDGIGEETKMPSNVIYTTKQFNIPGINENLGHSDMTSDCSILASGKLENKLVFVFCSQLKLTKENSVRQNL